VTHFLLNFVTHATFIKGINHDAFLFLTIKFTSLFYILSASAYLINDLVKRQNPKVWTGADMFMDGMGKSGMNGMGMNGVNNMDRIAGMGGKGNLGSMDGGGQSQGNGGYDNYYAGYDEYA
jgi:hypothetical protein